MYLFFVVCIIIIILIILKHKKKNYNKKKYNYKYIKDYLIQKDYDGVGWLNVKCQDINIRLCLINNEYDRMIKNIVKYMIGTMKINFIDHGEIKGISGNNIGIPLNIVVINNSTFFEVLFNPKILTLNKPIVINEVNKVKRNEEIEIEYYDYAYTYRRKVIGKPKSLSLRHVINNSNDILMTNK